MSLMRFAKAVLLTATSLPLVAQAAYVVDGINTDGEYGNSYDVEYRLENDPGTVAGMGRLWLGVEGTATGASSIFVLLEVPTNIQDLTYSGFEYKTPAGGDKGDPKTFVDHTGAEVHADNQNAAAGWYPPDGLNLDHAAYKKVQGSEKWSFDLAGDAVVVKMKDEDNDGLGDGYLIDSDGGGQILSASTSLDYNMKNAGATGFNVDYSPECSNPVQGGGTTDQDCYDDLDASSPDYQYAQRYEIEIDNFDNVFGLSTDLMGNLLVDISFFNGNVSGSNFHASKPKGLTSNDFILTCIDDGSCEETDTMVPVPGTLGLLGLALAGMSFTRRKKAKTHA